ncbi:uncharacterized protein V1516DRAFT_680297 [Lipomyces oligophaga]|uniref:uncharacterized protein n=1 Tax=Lipomyces oligophaga TaxID=45792 RepID=UPI0034CFD644
MFVARRSTKAVTWSRTMATKTSGSLAPPFTRETAHAKVKIAQNLWNTMNPSAVAQAYTEDSIWRNRDQFLRGTKQIEEFLTHKWATETNYKLRKELFTFSETEIAVNFWYEWKDVRGQWYRTYGLEHWSFAQDGRMWKRQMSGNDVEITETSRWFTEGVDIESVEIGPEHF